MEHFQKNTMSLLALSDSIPSMPEGPIYHCSDGKETYIVRGSARYCRFIPSVFVIFPPRVAILLPPQRPVDLFVSLYEDIEREAERARQEVDRSVQEVDGTGEHVHRRLVQLVAGKLEGV